MNLIEIAEQLKDVPDQYLMQEVQQPTGNYPSYLVVSELGRRKRMRDSVMKQMPETTVAEDLTQPERQQAMAQMSQMMQQPQDQNMIQQAGGLNALPQAQQDLAAMDMLSAQMPQEIPAMAGGGMVSFSNGGYTDSYTTQEEIEAYRPRGFGSLFGLMPEGFGIGNLDYELEKLGYTKDQLRSMDPATKRFVTQRASMPTAPAAVAATAQPARQPTGQPVVQPAGQPAGQPTLQPSIPALSSDVFKLPTAQERAAAAKAGLELYEQAVPDQLADFKTDLLNRKKEMEGRRGSNINEALIQAGLGIMGSRAPSALQAIAEGGLGGLKGYKEGMKDIRDSENAIRQSQLEMAKAQMLRDQEKFKQARDAEDRAVNLRVKGAELANSENAIRIRNALLPAQLKEMEARSAAYGLRGVPKALTAEERMLLEPQAIARLKRRGISSPDDAQIDAEIAIMRGMSSAEPAPALDRGNL